MTKEQYIQMRNDYVIDLDFLYSYFLSKGGNLPVNDFIVGFQYLDVEYLIQKLDIEFGLTILFDKNKNFIKVIQ